MSASGPKKYTIALVGSVADYTVAPLPDTVAAQYIDDVASFHDQSMGGEDDDRAEGLALYSDYPGADNLTGIYVKKADITVQDDAGVTVFESRIEDVNETLDWDDFICLNESSAYGLNVSCAMFSFPTGYGETISYEIETDEPFDIDSLMLIGTEFDTDGFFISKLFYDGEELQSLGTSGAYEMNKSTIVQFVGGNFFRAASHEVNL